MKEALARIIQRWIALDIEGLRHEQEALSGRPTTIERVETTLSTNTDVLVVVTTTLRARRYRVTVEELLG